MYGRTRCRTVATEGVWIRVQILKKKKKHCGMRKQPSRVGVGGMYHLSEHGKTDGKLQFRGMGMLA